MSTINVRSYVTATLSFKLGQKGTFIGIGVDNDGRRMVSGTLTRLWWEGDILFGAVSERESGTDTTRVIRLSGHYMIPILSGGRDHYPPHI